MDHVQLMRLLDRYEAGLCTKDEQEQLLQWYHSLHGNEHSYFSGVPSQQDQLSDLLKKIHQEIKKQDADIAPVTKRHMLLRITSVAAAVVLLALVALWLYDTSNRATDSAVTQTKSMGSPRMADSSLWLIKQHKSTATGDFSLLLPDGTDVRLAPGASVKYQRGFFTGSGREVFVTGKVKFDVAKHAGRPFTAYSGRFATTALGTVFSLNETSEEARIVLYSGKIVVRQADKMVKGWKQDIVLKPGEQLCYREADSQLAILSARATTGAAVHSWVFTDAPLSEVLNSLSKNYHTTIRFNAGDVSNMRFTGTLQASDSPGVILKAIAQMNGLTVAIENPGYRLQLPE